MTADEFLHVVRDLEEASKPRRSHPKGWEPGVDTSKGVLTHLSASASPPSTWDDIIRELGLDPGTFTVDESQPVQVRTWDGPNGDRLYYYRATVIPASSASTPDVEDLIREVKRRTRKPPEAEGDTSERALVVALADWQAGKPDGGGVEALVERLLALRDAVPVRIRELKRLGRPVDSLYVIGMGDLVEGCAGNPHYPSQDFNVMLDRRQQVKLVRRMLTELLTAWAPLVPRVVVGAVPGNHGENRSGGRFVTTFEDNDDVAVFEMVQEVLAANPEAYGHVRWVIPDGDLTITLDVAGTVVTFLHGHQARKGAGPQGKLMNWWKDKMLATHPAGNADVMVSGHYHHLTVVQDGPRSWFQCPANDGGSRWFEEQGGAHTVCGTLTFVCHGGRWSDIAVL
jgi:hypothetical protein